MPLQLAPTRKSLGTTPPLHGSKLISSPMFLLTHPRSDLGFDMPQTDTLIIRAELEGKRSTYRDIEIESSKSLYKLAAAIVSAFGFDFDHCFGFYTGLTDRTMFDADPKYELFADMGEADPGVLSVKKTKIAQAFPAVGHTMRF